MVLVVLRLDESFFCPVAGRRAAAAAGVAHLAARHCPRRQILLLVLRRESSFVGVWKRCLRQTRSC